MKKYTLLALLLTFSGSAFALDNCIDVGQRACDKAHPTDGNKFTECLVAVDWVCGIIGFDGESYGLTAGKPKYQLMKTRRQFPGLLEEMSRIKRQYGNGPIPKSTRQVQKRKLRPDNVKTTKGINKN